MKHDDIFATNYHADHREAPIWLSKFGLQMCPVKVLEESLDWIEYHYR